MSSTGLKGKIRDVSVWNAPLGGSDMAALYNEGAPLNLKNHAKNGYLKSWWKYAGSLENEVHNGAILGSSSTISYETYSPTVMLHSISLSPGSYGTCNNFPIGLQSFCVSFWVYVSSSLSTGANRILCSWGDSSVGTIRQVYINPITNALCFKGGNSSGYIVESELVIEPLQWSHCVISVGSPEIVFFMNGVLSTQTIRPLTSYSSTVCTVGHADPSQTMVCLLSNVSIWSTTLETNQILSLHQGKEPMSLFAGQFATSLVVYWKGNATTVFSDYSGNNRTLTFTDASMGNIVPTWKDLRNLQWTVIYSEKAKANMDLISYKKDFTFAIWIYSTNANESVFVQFGNDYRISRKANGAISVRNVLFDEIMTSGSGITVTNEWHHIALSRHDNDTYLYVDGRLCDTCTSNRSKYTDERWDIEFGSGTTPDPSKNEFVLSYEIPVSCTSLDVQDSLMIVGDKSTNSIFVYETLEDCVLFGTVQGNEGTEFGSSVKLFQSPSSTWFLVGGPLSNDVWMYSVNIQNRSVQLLETYQGPADSLFGHSVAISRNGNLWAAGAPRAKTVTVYEKDTSEIWQGHTISGILEDFGSSCFVESNFLVVKSSTNVCCYVRTAYRVWTKTQQLSFASPNASLHVSPLYMTVYDLKMEQGFYTPVCSIYRWLGSSWAFQKTIERTSISSEVHPVGGFMSDASDVIWLDNCEEPPKAVLYVQGQTVKEQFVELGTQAIGIVGNQGGRVAIRYPEKIVMFKSVPKGKDSYFYGNLAEAMVLNKCIPVHDILTILYNYGGPSNLANAYRPFLYGYWRFGNIQGQQIPDLSGKRHDISYKGTQVYNTSFPAQEPIPSVFEIVPRFYRFSLNNMSFNKSGTLIILIKNGTQVVSTETLSYTKRTVLTRNTIDLSSNTVYSYEVNLTTPQNKTGGRSGTVRTNVVPPEFVGNFMVTSFARRIVFSTIVATQPGFVRVYLYTNPNWTNRVYDHTVSFDGSLNEFVVSNLASLTTYYYTVEISNADGESNSREGSMETKIPIPAMLTLTVVPSLFDISFNNLTFDASCSVYIEMYTTTNFSGTPLVSSTVSFILDSTPLSFAFNGLPRGTQYYYKFVVTNTAGEVADIPGSVATTYLPTIAPGITTSKTFNSISINGVVSNLPGKIEYVYTTNGVSTVQTTYSYTEGVVDSKVITNLTPSTSYSIVIRAYPLTPPNEYTELSLGNITTDATTYSNAKSLQFNGTSSIAKVNWVPATTFSISMWINAVDPGTTRSYGVWGLSKESATTGGSINPLMVLARTVGGFDQFQIYYRDVNNDGYAFFYIPNQNTWWGNWHHLVLCFSTTSGTQPVIYHDGTLLSHYTNQLRGSTTNRAAASPSTYTYFGVDSIDNARYFSGKLDEIAIWNSILTQNEVTTLYTNGVYIDGTTNSGNVVSPNTLQAYWRFEASDGTDIMGGRTLTFTNTTISTDVPTFPVFNTKTLSFNGNNQFATSTATITLGNPFTFVVWAKCRVANSTGAIIDARITGSPEIDAIYIGTAGSLMYLTSGGQGGSNFTTSVHADLGWHMYAYSCSGTTGAKCYVDGILLGTHSTVMGILGFNLGSRFTRDQSWFNGQMDEIAIWTSQLSDAEVTAVYNTGVPIDLTATSGNYTSTSTLRNYWRFEASNGTDTKGNNVMNVSNASILTDQTLLSFATMGDTRNLTQSYAMSNSTSFLVTKDFTMMAWVYITNLGNNDQTVMTYRHATNNEFVNLILNTIGTNRYIGGYYNNTGIVTSGTQVSSINTWYHVAMTVDSSRAMRLYFNGARLATQTTGIAGSDINIANAQGLVIGGPCAATVTTQYFNGAMEHAAYWNTALSDTHMSEIYNLGNSRSVDYIQYSASPYLKGYWRNAPAVGRTIRDTTSNGSALTRYG